MEDAIYVVEGNSGRPPEVIVQDFSVSFEYSSRPPVEDGDWICNAVLNPLCFVDFKSVKHRTSNGGRIALRAMFLEMPPAVSYPRSSPVG